jgi:hypothetical protein
MASTRIPRTPQPDLFSVTEPKKDNVVSTMQPVFDHTAPIEQQIAMLNALIASPVRRAEFLTIVPEMAAYMLSINFAHNRRKKPVKIKEYQDSMDGGEWAVNGETVKFANDGRMHDGQNRMFACVRANKPFTTLAVFGIEASCFTTIDTGKQKNGDDMLTNAGYTNSTPRAAALRWLVILESANIANRSRVLTTDELLARQKQLDADGEDGEFNEALKNSELIYRKAPVLVRSTMTALLFVYAQYDPTLITQVLYDVDHDTSNMRRLRIHLESIMSSNHHGIEERVRNAFVIIAFNAYLNHKKLTVRDLKWTKADPYPKLPWVKDDDQ